jgi:DNA-binding transcriptional LysR family regulator
MEIDQLRVFLAVLEQGTFSRAGEALRIGQSTVSFHVQSLEAVVGARLLDRGFGRARPTAAGRLLRSYARKLLTLRDEALARLRAEEAGEVGEIVIAASTVPAEHLLPPALAAFRRTHPRVALRVEVSDSRRALTAIREEACDLAVVGMRVADRRLSYHTVGEDEVVLVAAARLAERALATLPLIEREEGSGTAAAARRAGDRQRPTAAARLRVSSAAAARRCVLAGLGVAWLSRLAVAEDVHAGRLRLVRQPGGPIRRRLWVVRRRGTTLSAGARTLLTLLVEGAGSHRGTR